MTSADNGRHFDGFFFKLCTIELNQASYIRIMTYKKSRQNQVAAHLENVTAGKTRITAKSSQDPQTA